MTRSARPALATRQPAPKVVPAAPRRDTTVRRAEEDRARIQVTLPPDISRIPIHPENALASGWATRIQRCGIGSACDCPTGADTEDVASAVDARALRAGTDILHRLEQGASHSQTGPAAGPRQYARQAEFVLGRADDPLEHEADRIAEQVTRMPYSRGSTATSPLQLSRKCAACVEGAEEQDEKTLRTARNGSAEAASSDAPDIVRDVLRSPGEPLDAVTRDLMESRFGQDFTGVRVHIGAGAASSARALNAQAYTLGNDVVFGAGKYSPNSADGRRLLAHELAHVVQQGAMSAKKLATNEGREPGSFARPAGASAREPASEIIRRSESVHPEEQYCEDLSADAEAPCNAIIDCINDIIELLVGRFADFRGDPGHLTRITIVQKILKSLMVLAVSKCKNGEYDKELEDEASKWANRKPGQQTEDRKGPATDEQQKTLRERLPSVPKWVWAAIGVAAAALIILCFASGVCEAAAIITAVGEVVGWIIVAAMRLAGIGLLAQRTEAAPSGNNDGTSAVA